MEQWVQGRNGLRDENDFPAPKPLGNLRSQSFVLEEDIPGNRGVSWKYIQNGMYQEAFACSGLADDGDDLTGLRCEVQTSNSADGVSIQPP